MRNHRTLSILLTTFSILSVTSMLTGNTASAAVTHEFAYAFGPQGFDPSGPLGAFGNAEAVAVDQRTGDVYVYDGDAAAIYKFNAAGETEEFSPGISKIEGVAGASGYEMQIAVDSSSGPDAGDIYVANGGPILIYGSDGKRVEVGGSPAELNGEVQSEAPGAPWGQACGVAVDSLGNVYVGIYVTNTNGEISEYTPHGATVKNTDYTGSLWDLTGIFSQVGCNVAVDSIGHIYSAEDFSGHVEKYAASQLQTHAQFLAGGEKPAEGQQITEEGGTPIVDPSDNLLYVDYHYCGCILQYESAPASPRLLQVFGEESSPGAIGHSYGVAVNSTSHDVYANNEEAGVVEIFRGVTLPDVTAEAAATNPAGSSATLTGTVNPLESEAKSPAKGIEFEYGLTTAYESGGLPASVTEAGGSSPLGVTASLSGLALNTVYHYRLSATNTSGFVEHSRDAQFTLAVAPAVEGQSSTATSSSPTGAIFEGGMVNPENATTYSRFAYIPLADYQPSAANPYQDGSSTPPVSIGAGTTLQPVARASAGELQPGTTYDYALIASNSAGIQIGADHQFTTAPGTPPLATTTGASNVDLNTATISGAVSPQGLATTYAFQVGTDPSNYLPPAGLGSIPVGQSEANVTLSLTDLTPDTTYYYRVLAINNDGTQYGATLSFATPAEPTFFSIPGSPPLIAVPAVVFPTETGTIPATTPKALTKKQKLARALKACHAKRGKQRSSCEAAAEKKYGNAKAKKRGKARK